MRHHLIMISRAISLWEDQTVAWAEIKQFVETDPD
jgi:hypothetical protein